LTCFQERIIRSLDVVEPLAPDLAYRIDVSWWVFVLARGLALVIARITVSGMNNAKIPAIDG